MVMNTLLPKFIHTSYRRGVRPLLFLSSSETIHEKLTNSGEKLARNQFVHKAMSKVFTVDSALLSQKVYGVTFPNPIGLSAGFDYRAQLTDISPALGFGFETVGTITNKPYPGNPTPRLGRLVRSKSLLVNKGFKNEGIDAILRKLTGHTFTIPIGLSIGRTNTRKLITQNQSIADICEAFKKAEASLVPFSFYELNISCPNLVGDITFYPPGNLRELLTAVFHQGLTKPLFIKMPIEKSNTEVERMLSVIVKFPVSGVIFGNLQKNREHPSLVKKEVAKYPVGNFSGKPCEQRSNELIALAYRMHGDELRIIGCGGVFSAKDAYKKIRLGASLVQLITGLIFEGPQLINQINTGLLALLHQDGFSHISQAIGRDVRS